MLDECPSPSREAEHALRNESGRALFEQNRVRFPGTPGQVEETTFCIDQSGHNMGETRLWDNGTVRISLKRLPHDQWREFSTIIEPSQGQRVGRDPCDGFPVSDSFA